MDRLREQIGSGEALGRFVDLFRSQTPAKLDELEKAVQDGELDERKRVAHFLKGSAASLGATRMTELCRELESAAPLRAPDLVAALGAAFDEAVGVLEREASRVGR